jgi:ubiquinone biosynthesis protein
MKYKIGSIGRTYRYINRYKEIITVLVRHGFGDLLTRSKLDKYIELGKKLLHKGARAEIVALSTWQRIRLALEELGPTFIKFGQIMSNRPDIFPKELIFELEKLQTAAAPFSGEDAKNLIEKELNAPISDLFETFSYVPAASASIAQIHWATLKSGEEVVVKVQRPGIEEIVNADLEIMQHLALLIKKHIPETEGFDPVSVVKEFGRSIKKEMDFTLEASNIIRFGNNFKDDKRTHVPDVFEKYTTKKILVIERVEGIKLSDINTLEDRGKDPKIISDTAVELILIQIFEHGFFHADPHPGNIIVLEDNTICFLDFGLMGVLMPKHRELFSKMIINFVNRDAKTLARTMLQFSPERHIENIEELELRLHEVIEKYSYISLKDVSIGELLEEILHITYIYKLRIPSGLYLLAKTLVILEGVCRKLDPDFNMVNKIEPFTRKLVKEYLNPLKYSKELFSALGEYSHLISDLPYELRAIMEKIKMGKYKVEFEHQGLEPMLKKNDQISNRIAYAIVLASLIVGSSVVIHSGIPPRLMDIPIIGIIGFLAAGFMGFWLLISILRHGKM